jgi:high affinity sulfate transporter 1
VSSTVSWLPGVTVARTYRRTWLRGDVVAGLVLAAMLVPQGMAYAELAGLPPVTGLYTTVVALLVYAVVGPSRILVLGPDSSLGPLIAATILPLIAADDDPDRAIALAGGLAILMGAVCIIAGLARLGRVTELLSKPVRVGYLNGIALVVIASQLPKLFGFSIDAEGFLDELREWARGVADGDTDAAALVIGVSCIAVMLACWRWAPRVPGVLVAVVGATVVVEVFDLAADGIPVVGAVPSGLPRPALGDLRAGDLRPLAIAAVGMAFVTLADTSAMSRVFAARRHERVDPNREIVALGLANAGAGLFQGFPVSASSSRTAVAESAGAKTQLVGVIGSAVVLAVLLVANGIMESTPSSALAAVVIVAALRLFDLDTLRELWHVRRSEFLLSMSALLGVTLVGVLEGIVIAVVLSLANFVRRQWSPYEAVLGEVPGRGGFHDLTRHPQGTTVPGVVVYRWDAPVFFANADRFRDRVERLAESDPSVHTIVIAAEPIIDIDTTGADSLGELLSALEARGVRIVFAELKGPVKDRLRRYGLYERLGNTGFPSTVEEAVDALRDISPDR